MSLNKECRYCLSRRCDAEIHASSQRVHRWLKERVESALAPVTAAAPKSEHFRPGIGGVKDARSPASRRKAARK